MRQSRLGADGPQTSLLALGTVNLGAELGRAESLRMLDAATDAGISMIDTADIYGRRPGVGYTERLIGEWLSTCPARRSSVLIATKIGMPFTADPADRGLGSVHLRQGCEAALVRLGVECIDLLQFHQPDPETPLEETWATVRELRQEGKVRYVGTSNHPTESLVSHRAAAVALDVAGPVSEQSAYSLLNRRVENDTLPVCGQLGVGFIAWSPLARGLLGGMVARRRAGDRTGRLAIPAVAAALDEHVGRLERYETVCAEAGYPPADVALSWLAGRPGVSAVVIGPRSEGHLASALAAATIDLDASLAAELDRIFPPGTPRSGWPHP
ncbi:MAG: hypothetical protein V7603_1958 [Micromonosporaceae bacterium]